MTRLFLQLLCVLSLCTSEQDGQTPCGPVACARSVIGACCRLDSSADCGGTDEQPHPLLAGGGRLRCSWADDLDDVSGLQQRALLDNGGCRVQQHPLLATRAQEEGSDLVLGVHVEEHPGAGSR